MTNRNRLAGPVALAMVILTGAATSVAQTSTSAALAKELTALLDARQIDSIAARDPAAADQYVAALYFPNLQLLVVSAKYSAPQFLNDRLAKKEYRDVYIDLNSASVRGSKVFIEDLKGDGLLATREENQPFDMYEADGRRVSFDGDWKKQNLAEDAYKKAFAEADAAYAKLLQALLVEAKKK
jgi:hypothetical protein